MFDLGSGDPLQIRCISLLSCSVLGRGSGAKPVGRRRLCDRSKGKATVPPVGGATYGYSGRRVLESSPLGRAYWSGC